MLGIQIRNSIVDLSLAQLVLADMKKRISVIYWIGRLKKWHSLVYITGIG